MLSEKETTRISKFLSLVLRHKPETIGIALDDNGWTDVAILLNKMSESGTPISMDVLRHIVDTNPKKRFAFSDTCDRIRANQGHSVDIELGYQTQLPPEILFHGTGVNSVEAILSSGLQKMQRHHVHLSTDIDTAKNVGQRHGKPAIFKVLAEQMYKDGFAFYMSDNGVWLTGEVPAKYLELT